MNTVGSLAADFQLILVEDDEDYAAELVEFLDAHGFGTSHVKSLDDLTSRLRDIGPSLLILDQFVGGRDSLPLIPTLKNTFDGGVVVLTGNQDWTDRIVALESGADDFVAKSLNPRELLARLRAVLRRSGAARRSTAAAPAVGPAGTTGAWRIDTRRVELRSPSGAVIPLTRTEFQALLLMAKQAGSMVSRDFISMTVLGRAFSPLDRSVDNMVSRIRKALEPHVGDQPTISSVRGKGYVFDAFTLEDAVISDPSGMIEQI